MSVIIVGADYVGNVIRNLRDKGEVSATQLTQLFGCGYKQLHRYENGSDLIPRDILARVFKNAVKMEMIREKE